MDTFVIRVWRAAGAETDGELRGSLELVGSRRPRPFQDEAELLTLLRQAQLDPRSTPIDRLAAGTSGDELS